MLPSNYCCGVFFAILTRDMCHYWGCVCLMMQEGIERDLSGKLHAISYVPLEKGVKTLCFIESSNPLCTCLPLDTTYMSTVEISQV
jgi:hypothetical protein